MKARKELDPEGEFPSLLEHPGKCVLDHCLAEKPIDDPIIHSHYYRADHQEFGNTNDNQDFGKHVHTDSSFNINRSLNMYFKGMLNHELNQFFITRLCKSYVTKHLDRCFVRKNYPFSIIL